MRIAMLLFLVSFGWVLGLVAAPEAAAQNAVSLAPSSSMVQLGSSADLALVVDFTDPALGGGIVIEFDTARLAFASFDFDAAAPDDPSFRLVCPSAAPACGSFPGPGVLVAFAVDTIVFPAVTGTHTLGTVRFDPIVEGNTALTLREDDSVAGPILGTGVFASPTLSGATVDIVPSNGIPVPTIATPWLLVLGLVVIGGAGLRREHIRCADASLGGGGFDR